MNERFKDLTHIERLAFCRMMGLNPYNVMQGTGKPAAGRSAIYTQTILCKKTGKRKQIKHY